MHAGIINRDVVLEHLTPPQSSPGVVVGPSGPILPPGEGANAVLVWSQDPDIEALWQHGLVLVSRHACLARTTPGSTEPIRVLSGNVSRRVFPVWCRGELPRHLQFRRVLALRPS